jgi:arginyl-tRNA synthetase
MIREGLTTLIKEAAQAHGLAVGDVVLEYPAEFSHGDYASNIALALSKQAGKSPKEIAGALAEAINQKKLEYLDRVEVAGPGFINFYLSSPFLTSVVKRVIDEGEKYGRGNHLEGKRVMVEYSQPNPFKPFHIGHLMSTTLGESISRLVEWSGAEVFRANYQGDIGPHVAKCIWYLRKSGGDANDVSVLGDAYAKGNTAYEEDPAAKEEIDALNQKLYAGDPELKALYNAGRSASLKRFEEIYKTLGTKFDAYFFESETAARGLKLVERGFSQGVFEKSEGAVVYPGEKKELHTRVFVTSKGTPTYETKELGLVEAKREKFPFDLNITTVAVEQDGYFKVLEAVIAELWPEMEGKYTHVPHGMMQLTEGKMSSRKGNVITGESILEDMRVKARERGGEKGVADGATDAIAVAGIKYMVLKPEAGRNIVFNPEKSLSLEGDSGPYMQYAYARIQSLLAKAREQGVEPSVASVQEKDFSLERLLYRFPEIVERAAQEYEPHYVVSYLIELSSAFNSYYARERIVDSGEHAPYRLALAQAVSITLKNSLWLLGIVAPERM